MNIDRARITALIVILSIGVGCASAPRQSALNDDNAYKAARAVAGTTHAGWIYARSVYENPINRPVSNATTLASLAFKSTGGMLRRVAISTTQLPALSGAVPELQYRAGMDLSAFERKLDKVTGTSSDTGRIEFLVDGEEYFGRLTNAIADAEECIDIRTYIFDNDDYAVELAGHLKRRSKDVRVRIMMDGLGTMQALRADPETLPASHKAPLSMRIHLQSDSKIKVRQNTNPWLTGDHTKTTIIDKKIAFVGGMNIGREYRYEWHDLMMEVRGPVVDEIQYESDKAWARAGLLGDVANFIAFAKGKKQYAETQGYPVRVLQTRNFDSDIHKAQLAAIQSAQSYIIIENAYFSDDRTVYELAKARRRGVDVRVIIPKRGNHGAMNASNKVSINELLRHGVRVYEYPGMTHVKAGVFDGWASVGSANYDKYSLKVNKELNLATSDPETIAALMRQVFIPDLIVSREIARPYNLTAATHLAEILVDELL